MISPKPLLLFVLGVLTLGGAAASPCLGLDPSHVLVLYNTNSADSAGIAAYYAQVHPQVRVLGITAPTGETIVADDYLDIRSQIVNSGALNPSIDCIVTTKGLPLRINNVTGSGFNRYSSLESELARIDSITTTAQMGQGFPLNSLAANPYYRIDAPFSYATQQMRLTSRLDGFTVGDVEASIQRAQTVYVNRPGDCFIMDDALTNNVGRLPYDRMGQLRDNVLAPRGVSYVYDGTNALVSEAPGPVLGYVTHGTNGGAPPDYLLNGTNFSLLNGAVFASYESYNAYTFTSGTSVPYNQGMLAQWIQKGGTAGVGNVYEPNASQVSTTNEDRMFDMLFKGYSWAEAAWNATQQLSYSNTVVGDPLMHYVQWRPEYGGVDGTVLATLCANWSPLATNKTPAQGDLNGDGRIDGQDIAYLFAYWSPQGDEANSDAASQTVPEPATLALLAVAGLTMLRRQRRHLR